MFHEINQHYRNDRETCTPVFKGSENVEHFVEELFPHNAFTIPLPFLGNVEIYQTVVITWLIMAVLVVLSILMTRKLQTVPTGMQLVAEMIVGGINGFVKGIIHHHWKVFAPFIGTLAVFLAISNTIGVIGIKPPTRDPSVTIGLALVTMAVVVFSGIRFKGLKEWLMHFKEPMVLLLPMNIMEIFIRLLSLSMRLFGNIFAGYIVMELVYQVVFFRLGIPAFLSAYFDLFDGLIQTIVFMFLSTLYISEAIE